MSEWQGRTAVISGGGRGFGKAFAVALCERGAHAVLVDLDGAAGEQAALELREKGWSAEALQGDVTDAARMDEVMQQAAGQNGGIDLLINNAGLHSDEYSQPMRVLGVEKVRRLFDVNVMGTVICTLAAVPFMAGRVGANVISISSMAAYPSGTAYGASKMTVAALTIAFASELGGEGIRVNAIAPGMILTETIKAELPQNIKDFVKRSQSLDADGAESDIVAAMLYLSGSGARFVTGETLRVTGGMGAGV
ncbi:MAG: SDR family NAD(P)-dependent oxidoreductase [Novosphingobium sp.]|nr:SDR family NAD(P)-dependent oxidoreductase [Novosphingobium sp.]